MEAVYLIVNGVGLVLDLLTLVLDLNFLLVSSLLASLAWLLAFIYNLPHTVLTSLLHLGRGVLLSLLALIEALVRFTFGGLQALCTLLYSCYSGLESLKLLGHLASHGALRSREILHRGVLNVVSSGHALLRQACDICAIAMSLVAYVINSLVNICLIGTQNLFSLMLALWDAVMGPLWRMTDVVAAFLAHISSSAVAMAILLWTPCQLALELLASAARLLTNFVLVNVTGLVLLACVLAVMVTVLHPDLTLRLATRALSQLHARPSYHRLREDVVRLSRLALDLEAWRRVWSRSLQLATWPNRGGAPGAPQGGPRRVPPARTWRQDTLPEAGPRSEAEEEEEVRMARATAARGRERLNEEESVAGQDPWKLLKEQEERKKCVICQDQSKTVLLLPCRHLCLCQACTEILMRHPVYHRNCPLCRRGILQTLNVYL
ncbi:E3 ubiquitin-protein ligase RNF26 [Canis lupus baileyi]|uniref:E3 ubiquitin-protein ligase RNF26 n=2 Tax=Canis lupus TaxID=9612 RepID=A0A8C0MBU3_CANLF|nr:E3 ubiquitin-protein ligase RNF26 [Canis lupus familiaris]XP_025321033.1 E3 ubiquitin-protein ligase RNF26 [Canis lupus dingo]XP_038391850.1 E3 ubiquitin-protein ligase RNF26 [Canis lupus familiaris]XP_038520583.1 E3 ubiquitin-protein ligase RNF26 [Canis lupus familiaris]